MTPKRSPFNAPFQTLVVLFFDVSKPSYKMCCWSHVASARALRLPRNSQGPPRCRAAARKEALSDFANYLTRGVQRRVEMMVAYKVEAKLDGYIPDGFSYTDAIKMQIAIYIAKGLVAPYFPPEDAEEEAREAEEEARKRLEEEKRKQQEGQEGGGFWSLFSWDDGEEEEEQKKEEKKEAESYLMSFFHKKVDEKSAAAKAEAERIATARYAQKKAEAEDAAKEEEEEQGVLATISNFFSSS